MRKFILLVFFLFAASLQAMMTNFGEQHQNLSRLIESKIEEGASSDSWYDSNGESMLHRAAKYGFVKLARRMLEHGANVNAKSKNGRTAIMTAAVNSDAKMARLLVAYGADLSITSSRSNSTVHYFADKHEYRHGFLLLKKGNAVKEELDSYYKEPALACEQIPSQLIIRKISKNDQKKRFFSSRSKDSACARERLFFGLSGYSQDPALLKDLIHKFETENTLTSALRQANSHKESPLYVAVRTFHFDAARIIFDKMISFEIGLEDTNVRNALRFLHKNESKAEELFSYMYEYFLKSISECFSKLLPRELSEYIAAMAIRDVLDSPYEQ